MKTKIGKLSVDESQLINPGDCEPWLRQIVDGFKKQTDSGVRCYEIPIVSVDIQKHGIIISEPQFKRKS